MSELASNNLATRVGGDLKTEFKKRIDKQNEAVAKAAAGDFQGAVTLLQDNLSWCEKNLGEDDVMTVWHLEELAIQLANLDRFAEAFDFDDRAYRLRKQSDANSLKALHTLGHFAYVILRLGRHELAAKHYELLWTAQKEKFGDCHEETIRTAAALAGCWQRMYKANKDKKLLGKATQLHSEVLQARTKQAPQDIKELVQSREDLGVDYISEDKLFKAKELFSKNIEDLKALPESHPIDVNGLKDRNDRFLKLIEGKESEAKAKRAEERRRRREEEDRVKKKKEVQEREKKSSKSGAADGGLSPQQANPRPRATSEASKLGAGITDKAGDRKRPVSEDRNRTGKSVSDEANGKSSSKDASRTRSTSSNNQKPEIKFTHKSPEEVRKQQSSGIKANGEKKDINRTGKNGNNDKTTLPAIIVHNTNLYPSTATAGIGKVPLPDRASSTPPETRRQDPKIGRSTSTKEKVNPNLEARSDVGATSDREQKPDDKHYNRKKKKRQGAIFDAEDGRVGDEGVQDWFDRVQEINEDFLDNIRKSKGTRVKIAILDTGIDLTHKLFQDRRSKRRIQKCENFLDDGETSDICGHGTHCAQLIRSIAPEADVYIARCVKDFDTDPDESAITKAIQRACRAQGNGDAKLNWDVDIISLSLGFYSPKWAILKALQEATHRNKLVFAAASNNGLRQQMTFPALLPDVICINAANGNGLPLDLNPPARAGKQLAILGENVESAWKCEPGSNNTLKSKTGTSVATPIAAAVAALMLEIAMMPSNGAAEDIFQRCLPYMRTYLGMTAILGDMAEERNSFLTIFPWKCLYHDKTSGEGGGDEFERTMLRLAYNSEQVLRQVYGQLSALPKEHQSS